MGDAGGSEAGDGTSGGAGEGSGEITLGVLAAVEGNNRLSQRALARELGIALGLANAYLKRCVRKGFVKVKQIPPNRYAYYLTPKGFAEKSRLTVEYLSVSFHFFRKARAQCAEAFAVCRERGWRRVALAGRGELADIAVLCTREAAVEIVGVIDARGGRVAGLRCVPDVAAMGAVDAVLVTDVSAPQAAYEALAAALPAERILTPRLLNVSRSAPAARTARKRN
ncbi:MAG: winged helix-turn-helix transcriptional regulator [Alphaproteobacteria bacterium]